MEKRFKTMMILAVVFILTGISTTTYAEDTKPIHLYSRTITLSPDSKMNSSTLGKANIENYNLSDKEFTLDVYDDNGVTVYSVDADDENYRESAMEYVNMLTGDSKHEAQLSGLLKPGQSEYHNDTQFDGNAKSYAWKKNTASSTGNNFIGGQASLWLGSGSCDYIVLNQNINVSGFGVSISWPPSVSGNGKSGSWQSQPIYKDVASASFKGFYVSGTAFSCSFTENGDVYKGGRIYRPVTYIKFSYFS